MVFSPIIITKVAKSGGSRTDAPWIIVIE